MRLNAAMVAALDEACARRVVGDWMDGHQAEVAAILSEAAHRIEALTGRHVVIEVGPIGGVR